MRHFSLLLFVFTNFCITNVQAIQHDLNGKVYDIKTKELIYTEEHRVIKEDGLDVMHSLYIDTNNKQIGTRKVVFENDRVNQYELQQAHIDYRETVGRNDNKINIAESDQGKQKEKSVTTKGINHVVIDAGFSNFIVRNWDQLLDGKTLKFNFASPSQMNVVKLQVKQAKTASGDTDNIMFNMTAANPFFKLLMTPVKIGYNAQTKQLAYYRGISNLQDENGDYYDVEITYDEIGH